jgi:glycosyltransferase involved in cell wall biosynthesis
MNTRRYQKTKNILKDLTSLMSIMSEPNIIAMYRIRNSEQWIKKSLESALEICSHAVIVDASTDNTVEICKSFGNKVEIFHDENLPFDETRDKNMLLEMALKKNPDFLFSLDADEILMPNSKKILLEEINTLHSDVDVFEFQYLEMWDKPNQYRYDAHMSNVWRKKLIRMKNQPNDLHYDGMPYPGNMHCPPIPQNSFGLDNSVRSRVKILHYGYYDLASRQEKFERYNKMDPDNTSFDGYRHLVSSDSKFSGPEGMEFRLLHNSMVDPKNE